jgi:hypothetical protein
VRGFPTVTQYISICNSAFILYFYLFAADEMLLKKMALKIDQSMKKNRNIWLESRNIVLLVYIQIWNSSDE